MTDPTDLNNSSLQRRLSLGVTIAIAIGAAVLAAALTGAAISIDAQQRVSSAEAQLQRARADVFDLEDEIALLNQHIDECQEKVGHMEDSWSALYDAFTAFGTGDPDLAQLYVWDASDAGNKASALSC